MGAEQVQGLAFALELGCDALVISSDDAAIWEAAAIARAAAGGAKVGSLADLDGAAALLAPQRPEQLLRTLPEVVVGDSGGLVPVRSELAQMLGAAPPRAARAPVASTAAQAQHDAQAVREARLRRFGGAEQAR